MTYGVVAELSELIDLQRYVGKVAHRPESRVLGRGQHLSTLRGRGMDFAEARNYQAGDEIRHMEWRVTARTGRPHVKIYEEERERPVVILVDFSPSSFFGTRLAFKSVVAARLSALLAWTVVKQGDRVGSVLFSEHEHSEFMPSRRLSHVLPLLAALSRYTMSSEKSLPSGQGRPLSYALKRVRRVARPGTILVIVSDFYSFDQESQQHLSRICAHNDVIAYHISDPLELAPPKPELYAISDGHQELLLDMTIESVRRAYQTYFSNRCSTLLQDLQRLQIQYVNITAETDLPLIVRKTFGLRVAYA